MGTRFYFRGKNHTGFEGYFMTNNSYTGYNLAIFQGCDPDTAENFRCWLEAARAGESYYCSEFCAEIARGEETDEVIKDATIKGYTTLEQCDARIKTLDIAFEGCQAEFDKLMNLVFWSTEWISANGLDKYNRNAERIDELKAQQCEISEKIRECFLRIYQLNGQE